MSAVPIILPISTLDSKNHIYAYYHYIVDWGDGVKTGELNDPKSVIKSATSKIQYSGHIIKTEKETKHTLITDSSHKLYHEYDISKQKTFNIKIQGICECIGWNWNYSTDYRSAGTSYIYYQNNDDKIIPVINIQHILTSITRLDKCFLIYNTIEFFKNLYNLTARPTDSNDTFVLPIP